MPLTRAGSLDPRRGRSCALWHGLLGQPVTENGRLCRGDRAHGWGDRRRRGPSVAYAPMAGRAADRDRTRAATSHASAACWSHIVVSASARHARTRARAARRVAMFLTGLAGLIAFNVILGVFGLVAAGVGLVAFIMTALFVIARSSRREGQTHG